MTKGRAPGFLKHPGYEIAIRPARRRYVASMGDTVLADSPDALVLEEQGYDPVVYFPRSAVDFSALAHSDRKTACPFKGEAEHFAAADEKDGGAIAWSYAQAYDEVAKIAGRVAFYPERVRVTAVPTGENRH